MGVFGGLWKYGFRGVEVLCVVYSFLCGGQRQTI